MYKMGIRQGIVLAAAVLSFFAIWNVATASARAACGPGSC
jgi:hypothetical protein